MRPTKLSEKLGLAALLLAAACASNHSVSPWGGPKPPPLGAYAEQPDLDAHAARIDAEVAPLRLRLVTELHGALPRGGGPLLVRGYEGEDALGRKTHAVRAATSRGVVMALGPLDPHDTARTQATALVPELVPGAFRSGTDLNGDGAPDVVVRNEAGALAIWRISTLGAQQYEIAMEAPPTRAADADEDGRIDLAGEVAIDPADPIAPRLEDVAIFDRTRYSNATRSALAYHARLAEPPPPGPTPSDDVRVRRAIERAWHAILADTPPEDVLKELDREHVPASLRVAFDRHRARLAALARGRR